MAKHPTLLTLLALLLLLTGCAVLPASCPSSLPVGWSTADAVNADDSLPFQFPLAHSSEDEGADFAWFAANSRGLYNASASEPRYHSGEDLYRPAGTPVYAIADGVVRYSGPTLRHGWTIAIDHPQANLYSLYSRLSLSGLHSETGDVERGNLIGHVGEPSEFSVGDDSTSESRLHLGMRAGQWANYPGLGDWGGMGIWVGRCPQDLGWLHPSITITRQITPSGGFPAAGAGFLSMWWPDILVSCGFLLAAAGSYVASKKRPLLLILTGAVMFTAGTFFYSLGSILSNLFFFATAILITIGIEKVVRRSRQKVNG